MHLLLTVRPLISVLGTLEMCGRYAKGMSIIVSQEQMDIMWHTV